MGRGGRRWRLGSFTRRPRARAARPTNRRCAAATATAGSPPQSHTRGQPDQNPRGRLARSSPLPAPLLFFFLPPLPIGAIPDPCGYTRHGEFDSDREAFVVEGEERQLTAWDFFVLRPEDPAHHRRGRQAVGSRVGGRCSGPWCRRWSPLHRLQGRCATRGKCCAGDHRCGFRLRQGTCIPAEVDVRQVPARMDSEVQSRVNVETCASVGMTPERTGNVGSNLR